PRFELGLGDFCAAPFLSFPKKENPPAAKRKKLRARLCRTLGSFLLNPGAFSFLNKKRERAGPRHSPQGYQATPYRPLVSDLE
ncbi:MAG: hypothetical protein CVT47_02545, partial [Thermoplasmata archaeon HGW-Thermoplasmata-2]